MTDYLTTDTELTSVADAIRTKGGTSAQLVYPTGFVSAIEAIPTGGGGSTKTVQVYLNSPKNASEAKDPACILFESDSISNFLEEGTQVGQISSPTGNTTVTMTKQILIAQFYTNGYLMPGTATGLGGTYGIIGSVGEGNAFYVEEDGYAYVSGVDYDD